jgi:hypothetical protein
VDTEKEELDSLEFIFTPLNTSGRHEKTFYLCPSKKKGVARHCNKS